MEFRYRFILLKTINHMLRKLILLLLGLFVFVSCSSQKSFTQIDQKLDTNLSKEIVLVRIINDSRCPENVQCVWAGQVVFEVAVYEKGKIKEQKQLTLTPQNQNEIENWFTNQLPKSKKPLKSVSIFPYPKDGVSLNLNDYVIQLGY